MAEKAERGARRKRSRRRGTLGVWRERLSFAVTLVTVSAVAIFLGWLMGQYAIQTVTGPSPSIAVVERPPTPSPAETLSSASSTPKPSSTTPQAPTSASQPAASGSSTPASTSPPSTSVSTAPTSTPAPASTPAPSGLWRVQVGAFNDRSRATALAEELRARGYDVFVSGQPPHRVQVGAFSEATRARATADDLKSQGFEAIVIPPG